MNTSGILPSQPGIPLVCASSDARPKPDTPRTQFNARVNSGDRVDLSDSARGVDASESSARLDPRIREIRRQIEAGTYLTPDKLEVAVNRLHAELFE